MLFQRLRPMSLLCAFLLISGSSAEDPATLKTEYSESAVNGSTTVNHRQWKTSRQGKVILAHEETGVLGRDTFELISTSIFHEGHKILQISSSLGKRLCSFEPQTRYKALLIDADGDRAYERIEIRDSSERLLDCFAVASDERVTPVTDAELHRRQESELRERTGG